MAARAGLERSPLPIITQSISGNLSAKFWISSGVHRLPLKHSLCFEVAAIWLKASISGLPLYICLRVLGCTISSEIGYLSYISNILAASSAEFRPILVFTEISISTSLSPLNTLSKKALSSSGYAKKPEPRFFETIVPAGQPRLKLTSL